MPRIIPLPLARHGLGELIAVAGWGNKPSGQRADRWSQMLGVPCLRLEDGFLRSAGPATDNQALSLIVDDVGIYYDSRQPSRLEMLITAGMPIGSDARCAALLAQWRTQRLSKYNHVRSQETTIRDPYLLVVDQTDGDLAIEGAQANRASFSLMLEAALDTYPAQTILLKTHPDVLSGRKSGCLGKLTPGAASRVQVIASPLHAPDVLEYAQHVYVVSSQMGFEALLWGRPVHTFGFPFYAGWGLTHDNISRATRRQPASLQDLLYAALIAYPRYVDPETGQRCEIEHAMAHVALQREMHEKMPAKVDLIDFPHWKRPIARAFFGGSDLRFVRTGSARAPDRVVVHWGSPISKSEHSPDSCPCLTIEDGFIRSVGLGAQGVRPQSWTIDNCGIYYDASKPSGLENLLQHGQYDTNLLSRARALIRQILKLRITKYNLRACIGTTLADTQGKAKLLVIGQVEGDKSLQLGMSRYSRNESFLRAVREAYPNAHLLFKPHPDVSAGLRAGAISQACTRQYCDETVDQHDLHALLQHADEVHVMTSLTGFEALLRGKRVVTHGAPFYAGWGLTEDRSLPSAVAMRRQRRLTLDILVAATLILYPRYLSNVTGRFTTPERILEEIEMMLDGRLPVHRQAGYSTKLRQLVTMVLSLKGSAFRS